MGGSGGGGGNGSRQNQPASRRGGGGGGNGGRRGPRAAPPAPPPAVVTGIGKRLLEKMGWKDGQGLGKQGEGRTEPVAASSKTAGDTGGLGFKGGGRAGRGGGGGGGGGGSAKKRRRFEEPSKSASSTTAPAPASPLEITDDAELRVMRRGLGVRINGLVSRPGLNGEPGFVDRFDPATGRHVVLAGSNELSLKQGNLIQMLPAVEVAGLTSAAGRTLNGNKVGIVDWDADKQRYICQAKGGRTLSLQAANMVVPVGTVVTLVGLTSEAGVKVNGEHGKVIWHHRESARLMVQLPAGRKLKVRYECVSVRG